MGSSPTHDQKFFCAGFFGMVRLFSQFFLISPKGPPSFFFYFAKEWMFKNSQRPPFTFFGTMRLTGDQKKFEKKIGNIFNYFLTRVL